jgi:eukaryotic-like serine/threonine-protein kinase
MNAENIPPAPPSGSDLGPATDADMEGLPRRLGKYTLIRKLAVGGMAELFLAIHRSVAGFEKLIVIKRILPSMNHDLAFIEMLLHEARVAATLSHPNIVQVFDVGEDDHTYFIAMEHVHGEDIRSIVRQMRKKGIHEFPIEHAISLLLGICAGLAFAHEKRDLDGKALNIVHRDISPQNVVVTFSGDVKIVDFGIAKSDVRLHADTRSGRLKGKVPYMSPEQARGEVVDWRSDIFAAGVLLFELTTGKRLFKGASDYETLKLICDREYPLPTRIREGYPVELETIVMRALAKDRDARFQSAREMQQCLEDFARRERIPVSTIALNQFMQSLFEDKLASQKEAISQGKLMADIIDAQQVQEQQDDGARLSHSVLSTLAASRTVTETKALRRRRGVALGVVGVMVVVGAAAATRMNRSKTAAAAPAATGLVDATPRGSLFVKSDPPGAAIWINGDLRPEVTPATIAQLPTGRSLEVKLTKDGFDRASEQALLTEADPKGTVALTLAKHIDAIVEPGNGAAPSPPPPAETHHSSSRGATAAAPAPAPASPPVVVGNGKLNVGASGGWCNVTVDGVSRGATPIAGLDVSAGQHKVSCTSPDGKAQTATVLVAADGTTRYRFTVER